MRRIEFHREQFNSARGHAIQNPIKMYMWYVPMLIFGTMNRQRLHKWFRQSTKKSNTIKIPYHSQLKDEDERWRFDKRKWKSTQKQKKIGVNVHL